MIDRRYVQINVSPGHTIIILFGRAVQRDKKVGVLMFDGNGYEGSYHFGTIDNEKITELAQCFAEAAEEMGAAND